MDSIPTSSPYPMVPMHEALHTIATSLSPLPVERVATADALHHILAADVHAPFPQPPFRASIKDGYAVHLPLPDNPADSENTPLLTVRVESHAGADATLPELGVGDAAYVTTGAPVPPGTSAVVMVERCTRLEDGRIALQRVPSPGADVREVGADVAKGELVLQRGTLLGAAEVGLLTSCIIAAVDVVGRPRVGVLSTGDEVVDAAEAAELAARNGGVLPGARIVDSNRPMLLCAVRESLPFCEAVDLGVVRDDFDAVRDAMQKAGAVCHVVLTSGGVSMGKRDVVKPVLAEIADVKFGRVVMKPGKPLTYATARERTDRCFVAMPGNPVSCFVCFHLAVAIAARRLAGWGVEAAKGTIVEAEIAQDIRLDPERPEYHRATVSVS